MGKTDVRNIVSIIKLRYPHAQRVKYLVKKLEKKLKKKHTCIVLKMELLSTNVAGYLYQSGGKINAGEEYHIFFGKYRSVQM